MYQHLNLQGVYDSFGSVHSPADFLCPGTHARFLCKRSFPKTQNLTVLAGLWQAEGAKKAQERLVETGIAGCVMTLVDATDQITNIVSSAKQLHRV